MVKKAVDSKAKSILQSLFNTKKMDKNYIQSNQPANSTIVKSQSSTIMDFRVEEPKVWGTKSSLGPQHFESSKKARKEKKKKQYQWGQEDWEDSTPAPKLNIAQTM